jgi:SIT family siderophore-iron:H+ symporter-like MFS transporter
MMYIVVADTTSLRWRVFYSMIPSLHSIINTWAAGVIAEKFVQGPGWRWGYGTGALIYPVMILPLIFSLVHTTHKAKKRGLLDGIPGPARIVRSPSMWRDFFWKADIIGLTFLIGSIALCLVPLTLGGGVASKWRTAKVLTPLVIGFVICIPAFVYWELKRAPHPLVPFHLLRSRHVLVSLAIGLLVTITGAQQSTYLYFLLVVAFGQSVEAATRISKLANFSMVISGLILGLVMHRFRHTKPFTIFGAAMYVLAFGLLYRFRGGHSASELGGLIGAEIVLGIGMGVAQNSAQCALQAVCKHEHVAIISAMFFCWQVPQFFCD